MADKRESGVAVDRRALIKKVGAGAAIVWAAPTVLASTAGAQTETCYFVKLDVGASLPGGCAGSDPSNGACANNYSTVSGCGTMTLTSFSVTTEGASATVGAGCDIKEMQVKAGTDCNAIPQSGTSGSVNRASHSPDGKEISHVSIIYCCSTAGSI